MGDPVFLLDHGGWKCAIAEVVSGYPGLDRRGNHCRLVRLATPVAVRAFGCVVGFDAADEGAVREWFVGRIAPMPWEEGTGVKGG